jgi:putative transposase
VCFLAIWPAPRKLVQSLWESYNWLTPRERLLRKRHKPEQIASILCDIQSDLNAGLNVNQALRKAGIGITTYYRWKAQQQAPVSPESLRLRELETEVDRLKHLVAELALDRKMLQEALKKKP